MQDYGKIQELFGAPLNTVPKPQVPFKLKPWHVIGGIVLGYVIYRGVKVIIHEDLKKFRPKIKKED
jgi:hypothetical protein